MPDLQTYYSSHRNFLFCENELARGHPEASIFIKRSDTSTNTFAVFIVLTPALVQPIAPAIFVTSNIDKNLKRSTPFSMNLFIPSYQ